MAKQPSKSLGFRTLMRENFSCEAFHSSDRITSNLELSLVSLQKLLRSTRVWPIRSEPIKNRPSIEFSLVLSRDQPCLDELDELMMLEKSGHQSYEMIPWLES